MNLQHLIFLFYIGLGLTFLNILFILIKKESFTKYTTILKLIISAFSYIGIFLVSGHLPVYDKFTTLQNIVLVVVLLTSIYNRYPQNKDHINIVWFVILILELLIFTEDLSISSDYYMYDKLYVILFFQFRITSMGLFVFALINQISSLFKSAENTIQDKLILRARNFTILGAVLFLCGEFSGSFWCLLWWGDPWHWSKGFFAASVMFMLSMLGSHLPFNLTNTHKKKALFSVFILSFILVTYLLPH